MNNKKYIIIGVSLLVLILIGFYAGYILSEPKINSILNEEEVLSVKEKLSAAENYLSESIDSGDQAQIFDAYMAVGVQRRLLGDYRGAMSAYEFASNYNVNNLPHPYTGMYSVASSAGKWNKALNSLEKAIALDELNTDYHIWKLEILEEKTKASNDTLMEEYEKAIDSVVTKDILKLNYSEFLERISNKEKALEILKSIDTESFEDGEFIEDKIEELSK